MMEAVLRLSRSLALGHLSLSEQWLLRRCRESVASTAAPSARLDRVFSCCNAAATEGELCGYRLWGERWGG